MSLGSLPETSLPLLKSAASSSPRSGSANHLRHGSDILEQLIQKDGLVVVGAEYSLETGVVDFFDSVVYGGHWKIRYAQLRL